MRTHSRGFVRSPRCAACSVIRKRASSPSNGAQKNDLRLLWSSALGLVRPAHAAGSRSVVRRYAHLSGDRGASRAVPELRQREARAARLPGGQSVLYQALCLLRGAALPQATIKDVAEELKLDWETVKTLEKQYMRAQLARAGTPGPKAIGIDEISIRKGHTYRIVVSDLIRRRPIWFGGEDRSESEHGAVLRLAGRKKSRSIRLAVMDMWKPFRNVTQARAPQAAILFDKFHVMRHLGEALDEVRKSEYAPAQRQGSTLHQGPEVHAAFAPREPHAGRPPGTQDAAGGQQALEHGLPAQGVLRSALGLRARGLGAALLRELAREPEVAAPRSPTRSSPR